MLRDRPFTVAEAREAGVAPGRLAAADLVRPLRGLRAPLAWSRRVPDGARAAALSVGPMLRRDEFVAHVSALALWGLPLPARFERSPVVHLGTTTSRPRRRQGIAAHRYVRAPGTEVVDGVRVVGPVEAWVQSAAALSVDELVVVGDALAGRWSGDARARDLPVEQLVRAVDEAATRPGVGRLRDAVPLVRPGVLSPAETRLRLLVVRAGAPEPELNARRYDVAGRYLGRPDLSWPRERLALEYEGDVHRNDAVTFAADIERREAFADAGWDVLRVTKEHVTGPGRAMFVRRVLRRLDRRR